MGSYLKTEMLLFPLQRMSCEGTQDPKQALQQTGTKEHTAGGTSDAKAILIAVEEGVQK